MHLRMAEYRAMLQKKYQLPVKQLLVYLGDSPTKMESTLPLDFQIVDYTIISMHNLQADSLLHSNNPDEVVLAILSKYPKEEAKEFVSKVLNRLQSLNLTPRKLRKYVHYLLTLGQLRTLELTIKQQVQDMPFTIDITKNAIYQEVKRESFERGIKKGHQEGLLEGLNNRVKIDIVGLLKQGKLSFQDIATALNVPEELVISIRDEMKKQK